MTKECTCNPARTRSLPDGPVNRLPKGYRCAGSRGSAGLRVQSVRRDGDDEPAKFRKRAVLQFLREQSRRIDRTGKHDLACGYNFETEPAVVGIVTHEHDQRRPSGARRRNGFTHQLGSESDSAMIGIDGDRSEQGGARPSSDRDLGHPEGRDELSAEMRDEAIPGKMALALTHPISRARKPSRPENARMQPRNFGNVLRDGFTDNERRRHGDYSFRRANGRLLAHFERRATLGRLANARGILRRQSRRQSAKAEK